jgi:hypothetical protein
MARKTRSEEAAATRAQVREWLQALMSRFGVTPKDIQDATGVNQATLYRWLREENDATLDNAMRIASHYRMALPGGGTALGLRESEAAQWTEELPETPQELPFHQSWWRIGNRALELSGVLPGDAALLDQHAQARAGDIVIAQIYNFERGAAETKIRYFDGLYLQTRTMDRSVEERPIPVDGERAAIVGRIVKITRVMI